MSKSTSETTWGPVTRVPIDATSSTVDHFIPGIGVDRSTSGGSARIGLTYYFYPNRSCSAATCQLDVGFISSTNGGASWSTATQLAGPMTLSWVANTSQGRMVGDYISTSVRNGANAFPVIAVALQPSGSNLQRGDVRAHQRPDRHRRRPPSAHRPGAGTKRHRPPGCPRIWVTPPRPLTAT